MFTEGKTINPDKIESVIERKNRLTIRAVEEKIVPKIEQLRESIHQEYVGGTYEGNSINPFDAYLLCFQVILYGLTLDELEFMDENNLFGFQKENLIDYKCHAILEKKIADFRKTLDYLGRSVSMENVGNYFQRFGSLQNQCLQGSKLEVILGLRRSDVQLTPLGERLKTCIDNIKAIHKSYLGGQDSNTPVGHK